MMPRGECCNRADVSSGGGRRQLAPFFTPQFATRQQHLGLIFTAGGGKPTVLFCCSFFGDSFGGSLSLFPLLLPGTVLLLFTYGKVYCTTSFPRVAAPFCSLCVGGLGPSEAAAATNLLVGLRCRWRWQACVFSLVF